MIWGALRFDTAFEEVLLFFWAGSRGCSFEISHRENPTATTAVLGTQQLFQRHTIPPSRVFVAVGRFNVNLYADGKVCLSLLGKDSGATASGGDKWNPETSSLWQVGRPHAIAYVVDPFDR